MNVFQKIICLTQNQEKICNKFEKKVLGASFELYNVSLRPLELIRKVKLFA